MSQNAFFGMGPIAIVGIWLAISTMIVLQAGWRELVELFPDRNEPAIDRLRFQSAEFGREGLFFT